MLKKKSEGYISVAISERKHIVAKLSVGSGDQYISVAECRNRVQAQTLVSKLNSINE